MSPAPRLVMFLKTDYMFCFLMKELNGPLSVQAEMKGLGLEFSNYTNKGMTLA